MISPLQYSIPWNWQRFGSLQCIFEQHNECSEANVSFEPYIWVSREILKKQRHIKKKDKKPVKLAQDSFSDEEAHACANLSIYQDFMKDKLSLWLWIPQSLSACPQDWRAPEDLMFYSKRFLASQHLAWTVDSVSHLAHQSGGPVNKLFYNVYV